jgi:hypothetical protein
MSQPPVPYYNQLDIMMSQPLKYYNITTIFPILQPTGHYDVTTTQIL